MAQERILIVDDDVDTLKLVGLMLQRQGYQIVVASSGPKALALVQEEPPDLILLDVMMPEMDGFEVARRLRSDPKTADIPILMFTAKSQVEDKLAGFDAGADDYLTKPAHPAELLARVKKLLRRGRETGALMGSDEGGPRAWTIGVLGVKGGLGVSSLVLNLGLMLHQESKSDVIVAELRPGQGTMAMELGYPTSGGLEKLLSKPATDLTSAGIDREMVTYIPGVRYLLSAFDPAAAKGVENVAGMERITRHVRRSAHYAVLDLGPVGQAHLPTLLPLCDEILLVVDGMPGTVKMGKLAIDYLLRQGVGHGLLSAVLLNRVRSDLQIPWTEIQSRLNIPVATVIPPAPELAYQSHDRSSPMVLLQPQSLVAAQLGKLVRQQIEKAKGVA